MIAMSTETPALVLVSNRDRAREIHNEISGYNPYTRNAVRDGKLYINAPGGLLPEQRALIIEHRDALIELLTTPPPIWGQCMRGHAIVWKLDVYGNWLCSCYFGDTAPSPVVSTPANPSQEHQKPEPLPVVTPADPRQQRITEPLPVVSTPANPSQDGKQWGVVFADIREGQAITEQGTRFAFPAGCSLSTFLEYAVETGPVNRVYLCGECPGGGGPDAYLNWLLDPGMMERYTTSKIGHSLDSKKPDMWAARYAFRAGRGGLDVRRMNAWLGDDRDMNENLLYTIEDARLALALVTKVLRQHFPLFRNLSGTPSTTFKHLWQQGNHIAKKQFPPLPDAIRALIHQNTGQGRIEYFPENCQGRIPGLYYDDGIFMYSALANELPTEVESHDNENTYAGKQSARYHIRYTVPTEWRHIGLFMTKRDGTSWRDQDGWFYPGVHYAGQTFDTWVDGSELDVCIQHYQDVPPDDLSKEELTQWKAATYARATVLAFQTWNIRILERIVFKPAKESQVSRPLETITRKLIEIRAGLEADKRQDAKNAHIYDLARGACRNIALHGYGAFNREQGNRTYMLLPGEQLPVALTRRTTYTELEDGRQLVTIPEDSEPDDMMHPEWAAAIWARCRARVTKQALLIPYEDLVTIRTDAIATKSRQEQLEGGTRPGQFRRKWAIEKPLKAPRNHEEFDKLQHKVLGK